jgi:predicted nicotinamide N-methyase
VITDKYASRSERFVHGAFSVDIALPLSPEDLLDELEFDADERLPYWAELWPSARALTRYVVDTPILPAHALELGCGVGLPSLALAWRGVEVTATDYYDDALAFAQLNAARNGLAGVATLNLDWREPEVIGRSFPLIIAADVLYEHRNAVALAGALPELLEPGGEMILADPGRAYRQHFLDLMAEIGWESEFLGELIEPLDANSPSTIKVALYRVRRPVAG